MTVGPVLDSAKLVANCLNRLDCPYLRQVGQQLIVLDLLLPPASLDLLSDRILAEVDHVAAWVISKRALIVMKRLAGRPKDLADLTALEDDA